MSGSVVTTLSFNAEGPGPRARDNIWSGETSENGRHRIPCFFKQSFPGGYDRWGSHCHQDVEAVIPRTNQRVYR